MKYLFLNGKIDTVRLNSQNDVSQMAINPKVYTFYSRCPNKEKSQGVKSQVLAGDPFCD